MLLFELRTRMYFGRGKREKLLQYLSEYNIEKCGVVIDSALLSYDLFRTLIAELEKGLKYLKVLKYEYGREPTYSYLDEFKGFFKEKEIECLIGIGGGSAIDVAKGLAVLIKNPVAKSVELRGFPKISNEPVPIVAIPTISGTGTEVTYNAVFIDEFEKKKLGINTTLNFPIFSLLDPELTLTAPLKQSISSALDCLVHAVESFMSEKKTFISRLLSTEAFYYTFKGLQDLLKDPEDINAREQLMKASYLAGIALMNSSSGPAGALSYPLGTLFRIPHGLAGAFYLQYILAYNLSKGYNDFSLLYDRVNGQDSISPEEKSKRIIQDIIGIIEKAGTPKRLSEFGVGKENISDFAQKAKNSTVYNPVSISQESLTELLTEIL